MTHELPSTNPSEHLQGLPQAPGSRVQPQQRSFVRLVSVRRVLRRERFDHAGHRGVERLLRGELVMHTVGNDWFRCGGPCGGRGEYASYEVDPWTGEYVGMVDCPDCRGTGYYRVTPETAEWEASMVKNEADGNEACRELLLALASGQVAPTEVESVCGVFLSTCKR